MPAVSSTRTFAVLEGGSEEPNAECCLLGRVDVAERMRSFLSARGICAVRFPSAVCLLMPDGSNDLGACDGWMDGSESRIRKMRFEDKAVDFLGKKWLSGLRPCWTSVRIEDRLTCGVVLREGPAVVARLVRAGYAPDIPRTSSNANLNSR